MLLRFIFKVVVPVSKTVKTFKKNVQEMQNQQQAFHQYQQNATPSNPAYNPTPKASSNTKEVTGSADTEYIDFEEVK